MKVYEMEEKNSLMEIGKGKGRKEIQRGDDLRDSSNFK